MRFLLVFLMFFMGLHVQAQMTMVYDHEMYEYVQAMDLLDKEKYGAAMEKFQDALGEIDDQNSELSANAHFYIAFCALELFHKDAEHLLNEFVLNYPSSPRVREAYFLLGNYNYRKKDWKETIRYFEMIGPADLKPEQKPEYNFKLGYALFQEGRLEEGANKLYQVTDETSPFYAPAKYYFGHINYEQNNFETALDAFLSLEKHPQFQEVVPYYIVQIYYYQKKYDDLIAYGTPLLESSIAKREAEIARLVGEAHYHKKEYPKALPFLEAAIQKGHGAQKEDYYQLGYAYYMSGNYDQAADYLSRVSYTDDSLAQFALYALGNSYLKAEKKAYARTAYQSAARLPYDASIAEDALYKYALLSYELSYDPYDSAIEAFKEYVEKYPGTDRSDEAYGYLVNIYLTSKNYDAAIASIEEYERPDIRLQAAYQRVTFNKGVELFESGLYEQAAKYFTKSLGYQSSKKIAALSHYWKAEALYRMKDFPASVAAFERFVYSPGAILTPYFNLANYNIGYAYFEQDDFTNAPTWFRRFTSVAREKDSVRLTDAHLRTGDSYFMLTDYRAARDYYQAAMQVGGVDKDYAIYQLAMTSGLLRNLENKISLLGQLIAEYPNSRFLDAAYYETGRTYIALGKEDLAIENMEKVVEGFPTSSYVRKALVSIGQTHFNNKRNQKALEVFMRIIKDYPTYEDTREALVGIRNIYTEQGQVSKYEELVASLDFVNISEMALDSINYDAIENQYFNGNCADAVTGFTTYLERFDPPIFAINARFYRAECLRKLGRDKEALEDYSIVSDQPKNKFTESSLLYASRLQYKFKDYPAALASYKKLSLFGEYKENLLEAEVGQMRVNFELNNYQGAIANANTVLETGKLDPVLQFEAIMIIAKSELALGNLELAEANFKKVAGQSAGAISADAVYQLAQISFRKDSLDRAEKQIFNLVENHQGESYWVAKGLVLLSDVYLTRGDIFQAKATLQSIVDNYVGDDEILETAKSKLGNLEAAEKVVPTSAPVELEIDMGTTGPMEEIHENPINPNQNDTISVGPVELPLNAHDSLSTDPKIEQVVPDTTRGKEKGEGNE